MNNGVDAFRPDAILYLIQNACFHDSHAATQPPLLWAVIFNVFLLSRREFNCCDDD